MRYLMIRTHDAEYNDIAFLDIGIEYEQMWQSNLRVPLYLGTLFKTLNTPEIHTSGRNSSSLAIGETFYGDFPTLYTQSRVPG